MPGFGGHRALPNGQPFPVPPSKHATPATHPQIRWWCHRCHVSTQAPCWFCGGTDALHQEQPQGSF